MSTPPPGEREALIRRLFAEANKADDVHADLMREAAEALAAAPSQPPLALSDALPDDSGASPSATGLSASGPSPAVSAVPASIPGANRSQELMRALARAAGLPDAIAAHPGVKDAMNRAFLCGYGAGQLDGVAVPFARGIGVRSTTTEGRGPQGAEPGPKDAPNPDPRGETNV